MKINLKFRNMKTLSIFTGIMMILMLSFNVNAQDQVVYQGTTHSYSVGDNGYDFSWSVGGAANNVLSPAAAATDIEWGELGTHTLTLTESNGSCTTDNAIDVEVIAAPEIAFTDATSQECADEEYLVAISYNGTGTTGYPLEVTYTDWNGNTGQSVTFNDGDPLVFTIPAGDRVDKDPAANWDLSQMEITGATGPGGNVTIGAQATHVHTVNDVPESNPINF
jgi:hypothetical protein